MESRSKPQTHEDPTSHKNKVHEDNGVTVWNLLPFRASKPYPRRAPTWLVHYRFRLCPDAGKRLSVGKVFRLGKNLCWHLPKNNANPMVAPPYQLPYYQ